MASLFTMFRTDAPPAASQAHVLGAVAAAAAMVALLAVFHGTTGSLLSIWTNSVVYGHGLLIPVIAGYLAYQRRTLVARAPVRPAIGLGGAALALAGIIWLAGDVTGTQLVQHVGLVGMLQSVVLLVLGIRITLALALPLAYLVLAIPFGESLLPMLQDLTAKHTTQLLRATGVPVHLADWKMITPDGAFLVARVCAGLQYILACLAIGGLIAGIWYRTPWKRLVVLAVAIAVPIGANVLRAYGIVMLAHLVSFEAASGVAHVVYGFVFLSIISFGFILLAARFRESGVPAPDDGGPGATAMGTREGHARRRTAGVILAASVAVALALGIKGTAAALAAPAGTAPTAELVAPAPGEPWRAVPDGDAWHPSFHGRPLRTDTWTFTTGDAPARVTVAQFPNTGPGSDITGGRVFAGTTLADAQITHRGRLAKAPAPDAGPPAYLRLERHGGPAHLVWYWYAVEGRLTGDPVTAKLYQLLARLRAEPSTPRLIVLSTPAGEADSATLAHLAAALDMARLAAPTPSATE
jgi:exosortase A